jgi:hypothetical protein
MIEKLLYRWETCLFSFLNLKLNKYRVIIRIAEFNYLTRRVRNVKNNGAGRNVKQTYTLK